MVRPRGRAARPQPNPQPDQMQIIIQSLQEQRQMIDEIRETQARERQEREERERAQAGGTQQPPPQPQPQPQPQQPPVQHVPIADQESLQSLIPKFCMHQPPSFTGKFDIEAAEDWILRLEKIFRVMGCSSEHKAQMAIFKLEEDADKWWQNTELTLQARNIPITWDVFKEKFNQKYFPQSARDAKEAEFLVVQQAEDESFDDYLARFIRLSRYSTYLRYRDDERWSIQKLVRGLKPALNEKVAPNQPTTFDEAVEICRITESSLQYQNQAGDNQKPQIDVPEGSARKRKIQKPWNRNNNKRNNRQGG